MKLRTLAWACLLSLACVLLIGCVEGDSESFIAYDAGEDSFEYMEVYSNIVADTPADVDHLESLWKRRGSIVLSPNLIAIFGRPAYERLGGPTYRRIDLARANDEAGDQTHAASVDLDRVTITPGKFFLNKHGNLSTYHRVSFPGELVDAILPKAGEGLSALVNAAVSSEANAATQPDARQKTWDQIRREFLEKATAAPKDDATEPPAATQPADKPPELLPLDEESKRLLKKAAAEPIRVRRVKDSFVFTLPLSRRDTSEAIATLELMKTTLGKEPEALLDEPMTWALIHAMHLEPIEEGLSVTLSIATLASHSNPPTDPQPKPELKNSYRATVASIRGRGIEIDKELDIKRIVREFLVKEARER